MSTLSRRYWYQGTQHPLDCDCDWCAEGRIEEATELAIIERERYEGRKCWFRDRGASGNPHPPASLSYLAWQHGYHQSVMGREQIRVQFHREKASCVNVVVREHRPNVPNARALVTDE